MTTRILFYAEGDFSFTEAFCKQLCLGNRTHQLYEIVSTDFIKHDHDEIENINIRIRNILNEQVKGSDLK